eukprot:gb/GECH01009168.1/.p1 GENE.gb/GECH01009168.1/~~gb/GECH01009168.1/.p1  ORF type:complete len:346 (+),score=27.46 gb/GECH01009168.1/:1-1038(+)
MTESTWLLCAKNEGIITDGCEITYCGNYVGRVVEKDPITLHIEYKGKHLHTINELIKQHTNISNPGSSQRSELAFCCNGDVHSYEKVKHYVDIPTNMLLYVMMDKEHNINIYAFFQRKKWKGGLGAIIRSLTHFMELKEGKFCDEEGNEISENDPIGNLFLANRFIGNQKNRATIKIMKIQSFYSHYFPYYENTSLYSQVVSYFKKPEVPLHLEWCENFDVAPIRFKKNKLIFLKCNNHHFAASNSFPLVKVVIGAVNYFCQNFFKASYKGEYNPNISLTFEVMRKVENEKYRIEYFLDLHHTSEVTPTSLLDARIISSQFSRYIDNNYLIVEPATRFQFSNRFL